MTYDLTNRRFGSIVVEECLGPPPGKRHRYWRCRCDCGNVVSIPQYKLTAPSHAGVASALACPECQRRPCDVCGSPVPLPSRPGGAPRTTCSEACRQTQKRERQRLAAARKRERSPEYDARLREQKRERMQRYPEYREHVRSIWHAQNERRRRRETVDDRIARHHRNRRAYVRRRAAWLALSQEEREHHLAALRQHRLARKNIIDQQRRRRRLHEPPERKAQRRARNRAYERERRRRQALENMNIAFAKLQERSP